MFFFSCLFWQLPPPEGGLLGDLPFEYIENSRQYAPCPSIAHGQSLMWSGPETCVEGVTELQTCERTDNVWLQSVLCPLSLSQRQPMSLSSSCAVRLHAGSSVDMSSCE